MFVSVAQPESDSAEAGPDAEPVPDLGVSAIYSDLLQRLDVQTASGETIVIGYVFGIELEDPKAALVELAQIALASAASAPASNAEQVEELFNDDTSRQQVADAFADRLGLTEAESECFLSTVNFEDLAQLESTASQTALRAVVDTLTACGIDTAKLDS